MTAAFRELSVEHGDEIERLGGSARLLSEPHVRAFGLQTDDQKLASFVMVQIAADEADIVDIATDPELRRCGHADTLLRQLLINLTKDGIRTVHLDVDEANDAALALYHSTGFVVVGRRKGYYRHGTGAPTDALLMSRAIDKPDAG